MGGRSRGGLRITPERTLEFFGELSLANNGGFASMRSRPRRLALKRGDELVARVRGDGRAYSLNLYVPRPRTAFAYRAAVATANGEWLEVRLGLERFVATSFGRPVPEEGPVDPAEVDGLGFLLGDKQAGPFRLEIGWIQVAP